MWNGIHTAIMTENGVVFNRFQIQLLFSQTILKSREVGENFIEKWIKMLKENKLFCKSAMMFHTSDHGHTNANMTHRRRNRTRKFNLNMSWYGTLYKRIKGSQKTWTLHHNPLHGKFPDDCPCFVSSRFCLKTCIRRINFINSQPLFFWKFKFN